MNPIVQQIFTQLLSAARNKHTTGAAIAYAVGAWGCPLLAIWVPSLKEQLEATATVLKGSAIFYGFVASGDASKSLTKDEAATTFVKKTELIP